jgi:hypothetical protein
VTIWAVRDALIRRFCGVGLTGDMDDAGTGLLGVDHDLGSIKVGKLADLVLVAGDPLQVDTLADGIGRVCQAGELVAQ